MRQPGELVKITYDTNAEVDIGDYIQTSTGRLYYIIEVRKQLRGKHVNRKHLKAIVMGPDEIPEPGTIIHDLVWNRR